jgi:hypothetical protein
MKTDVQSKANSVPSRSNAVGSMVQRLISSDGDTGRAVNTKKRDMYTASRFLETHI